MFLFSLNCFFQIIKNGVPVNSLMAKRTSTINKAFTSFFFFTVTSSVYRYTLKGKNHGKIEIIATIADAGNAKNLSIFSFPTEYQREEITSVLIKMSWILLTLLFMSLPCNCFAAGDNNTGGPSCNDNVSK